MRPVTLACLFLILLALAGCAAGPADNAGKSAFPAAGGKIKVLTTIYPLYDFAVNVGGDKAEVAFLTPAGTEPHEWEPSPKDLEDLQKAGLFIYCGTGIDSWCDRALKTAGAPGTTVVDAGQGIDLISGDGTGRGAGTDPHIWVDPVNAMKMVDNITAGFVRADPANKEYYEANAEAYQKKLEALHEDYRKGLSKVKHREFITSHAAFGYLARRYGLVQVPVRGLSPEVEPTPARMADVIRLVKEKNIHYIFFESMVSPKTSEIIAAEAGAQTLVLNPVENLTPDEIKAGKDYLAVMRENLHNLQKALEVEQ